MAIIRYKVQPWTDKQDSNDHFIKVGVVYIKVIHASQKNRESFIEYWVKTPKGIKSDRITASEANIPLNILTAGPNTNINIENDICGRSNYTNQILEVTTNRGHTLGKKNRKWLSALTLSSVFGGAGAVAAIYTAYLASPVVAEFLTGLSTLAFTTTLSAAAAVVVGLAFVCVGSYLLFKGKDCNNNTSLLEGSLVSAIGWSGLGAAVGALLGVFLLPAVGPAFLAVLGCGVGLGLALIMITTAVMTTYCCTDPWQQMVDTDSLLSNDQDLELKPTHQILHDSDYDYETPLGYTSGRGIFDNPKKTVTLADETEASEDTHKFGIPGTNPYAGLK